MDSDTYNDMAGSISDLTEECRDRGLKITRLLGLLGESCDLLSLVGSNEFEGIWCEDSENGNWFDVRDSILDRINEGSE
jgi:hypothetical protein